MIQHQEQETRETLPRLRLIHEDLHTLGTKARVLQAAGFTSDEILRSILAQIDGLQREWQTKFNASMNALADAVNDKDGWVGELTTDQWERVAAAIDAAATEPTRLMREAGVLRADLVDVITADVKAHLEHQEGDAS